MRNTYVPVEQQDGMGAGNTTAYKISYNPPQGTCDGSNQSVSMTQSVAMDWWGKSPNFDDRNDDVNKGKPYPVYQGQGDSNTHIIDSPFDIRSFYELI